MSKAKTNVCDGDETEAFVPNTIAEIHVSRIVSVCMWNVSPSIRPQINCIYLSTFEWVEAREKQFRCRKKGEIWSNRKQWHPGHREVSCRDWKLNMDGSQQHSFRNNFRLWRETDDSHVHDCCIIMRYLRATLRILITPSRRHERTIDDDDEMWIFSPLNCKILCRNKFLRINSFCCDGSNSCGFGNGLN